MQGPMKKRALQIGFVADAIESFDREAETTFFLMKEAFRRGYKSWVMEPKNIFTQNSEVWGTAKEIEVNPNKKIFSWKIRSVKKINLGKLDCLFVRKDPPADLSYYQHLNILELLEGKVLMINSPRGIKKGGEKIYPFFEPQLSPPSVITCAADVLDKFLRTYGKIVVKPLHLSGGRGIFILHQGDSDRFSLFERATDNLAQHVLLQKFVPEARKGDKRILLFNGEILGAFIRVPAKNDFRGNLHSGARFKRASITLHERKIISQLKSRLIRDGLYFVGIDFLGPYVTEINTTSPMGIREVNQLYGIPCERTIFNGIEEML